MTKKLHLALCVFTLLFGLLAMSALGASNTRVDLLDGKRSDNVNSFNVGPHLMEDRQALEDNFMPGSNLGTSSTSRLRGVGAALTPHVGIGPGVSIDQTWDDAQWIWGQGRHVATWWNGQTGAGAEVSVHFVYRDRPDTIPGFPTTMTGYNVYDAIPTSNNWPRAQDVGCDLESTDTSGFGRIPSMDMMDNGRVVIASDGLFFRTKESGEDAGSRYDDNIFYFQGSEFNCSYDPRSGLNVSFIDTTGYRDNFMDQSDGSYSRDPQIVTQWDGAQTITHLVLGENNSTVLSGDHFVDGDDYRTWSYYRKLGNSAFVGTWSGGQVLDTLMGVWTSLAAAPYPHTGLGFVYANESYYGALLNNNTDVDIWCRESFDRGLTWETSYSITNYTNAIANDPAHFTGWLESGCMFDSEGDLHAWWTAKPSSDDPYFDGFNWNDFDENLYHWEKDNGTGLPGTGDIVKVANGNFMNDDMLTGSMNTFHCGFGGTNVGYLGWSTMGQCDDKLYMLWSQIHERANRFPWRDAETVPAPGVLDDCSYTGERLAMANWEILMSVAKLSTSSLWDAPRNISNTYTPDCGLLGDPEADGLCGSEWKPSVEKWALDETGMSLTWPVDAVIDLSPGGDYAGDWYLNMEYMDDQFPGPYSWGRTNPPGTENSMKWVRLACVEPVEASQIVVSPSFIQWPEWVELGQTSNLTITVRNEGNVMLNVSEIGFVDGGGGWMSVTESPTPGAPFQVTAGVVNTATFDIVVDASGLASTQWLDGEIWLKSDAANFDSVGINIHILAAAEVEDVVWDTVLTHANMFDTYFPTEGACVALAVGNAGDLGWGAGTAGSVNLDYVESEIECGDRFRDALYLFGASAFTILADDAAGTNAVLTQSQGDGNQADETGWDPIGTKGSISGGVTAGGEYDSVYTGRFVNRDTTIAMERIVYGPRSTDPENETINFMIVHTKVYSADGAGHDHLTVGNMVDWDVPAEDIPNNITGLSSDFLWVQGTDTTGILSCNLNVGRYATEAFGGGYTAAEWEVDSCAIDGGSNYSVNAILQTAANDTTHYRDGSPLTPNQPNPLVWWDETGVPGMNADATVQDQAVWFTYKHDYNLGASDTLNYWTVLTTTTGLNNAAVSLTDLEGQVATARKWYMEVVRGCETGCCVGQVGDANNSGDDIPTIGDISVLIDAKFISGTCDGIIVCLEEADINQSGGATSSCDEVTIGDISYLIDYLFITGPSLGLNPCL